MTHDPPPEHRHATLWDDLFGHGPYVVEDDGSLRVHVILEVSDGVDTAAVVMPIWLPGPTGMTWLASARGVDRYRVLGRHYASWPEEAVRAVDPESVDPLETFCKDLLGLLTPRPCRSDWAVERDGWLGDVLAGCNAHRDPLAPRFLSAVDHPRPSRMSGVGPLSDVADDVREAAQSRLRRMFAFDGKRVLRSTAEPTLVVSHCGNGLLNLEPSSVGLRVVEHDAKRYRSLQAQFSLSEVDEAEAFAGRLGRVRGVDVIREDASVIGRAVTVTRYKQRSIDALAGLLVTVSRTVAPRPAAEAIGLLDVLSERLGHPTRFETVDVAWDSPDEWRTTWDAIGDALGPHDAQLHMYTVNGKDPRTFELVRTFLDLLTYGGLRHP